MVRLISSRDTSFTRYWFLTIDGDVEQLPETSFDYVSLLINQVLNHPQGWNKFGYKFIQIDQDVGLKSGNKKSIFHLRLSTDDTIESKCELRGLSCADMSMNVIYLNVYNWIYGSKKSEMTPELLRWYCINHEIGHLLGRNHKSCGKGQCSIMLQQTIKSKNCCKPNIFPLSTD